MPDFRSKEEKITKEEFFKAIDRAELGTIQKYVEGHKNRSEAVNSKDKDGNSPLFKAIKSARDSEAVVAYLVSQGADYTLRQGGKTAEETARSNQNLKIGAYLKNIDPAVIQAAVLKNMAGSVKEKDPNILEALKNYSITNPNTKRAVRDKKNLERLIALEGDADQDQDQENKQPSPKSR